MYSWLWTFQWIQCLHLQGNVFSRTVCNHPPVCTAAHAEWATLYSSMTRLQAELQQLLHCSKQLRVIPVICPLPRLCGWKQKIRRKKNIIRISTNIFNSFSTMWWCLIHRSRVTHPMKSTTGWDNTQSYFLLYIWSSRFSESVTQIIVIFHSASS